MTEAEWLASSEPISMLAALAQPLSDRKLRLWMTGCHRRLWRVLSDLEQGMPAATEQYLEGKISIAQFDAAFIDNPLFGDVMAAPTPDEYNLDRAMNEVGYITEYAGDHEGEVAGQAELVREIFGNPFHPVAVKPDWLSWGGGAVPKLAQSIYDQRALPEGVLDQNRLLDLANTLERAGCATEAILSHCREPGPHVLGCWVIDLLLGKK